MVRPNRRYVQGVERILTTTLGCVLQKDAICRKCGKKGHFLQACRSKKISSIKGAPEQSDKSFSLRVVWVQKTEPRIPSPFLELPWQKVGMDLLEWQKLTYLTIVDYYSRFIKIAQLDWTTAEAVIQHCKNIFSRHDIPEEVVTDNVSQFDFNAFRTFSREYQFRHVTSSPYCSRSNGVAEQRVKTAKALLKKGDKPYLVLLAYSSTPLSNGYSPAEFLMNRKLRTNVPSFREAQKPHVPVKKLVVAREEEPRRK